MGAVMAAWLAEMGIQTWKSKDRVVGLPVPSIYLADMVIFGFLAFGAKESSNARPVAGLLAWGIVLATALNNPLAPAALATKLAGGAAPANAPSIANTGTSAATLSNTTG